MFNIPYFKPILCLLGVCFIVAHPVGASPEDDLKRFQNFFFARFPHLELKDFAHGINAIDEDSHSQWLTFEDFPPYEEDIETGRQLFNTPFRNGRHYRDCFDEQGAGVRQHYPRFNATQGSVETLELALNNCRSANGHPPLEYGGREMLQLTAYLAFASRGEPTQLSIPNNPEALAAYEAGKRFYYSKRGQLNMSCAGCHVRGSNLRLRGDITSPALGHTSHFPVYRLKWQGLGSLHKRFAGCNRQVRSAPFPLQSKPYRELEYFLTFMSNGIPLNGPSVRP